MEEEKNKPDDIPEVFQTLSIAKGAMNGIWMCSWTQRGSFISSASVKDGVEVKEMDRDLDDPGSNHELGPVTHSQPGPLHRVVARTGDVEKDHGPVTPSQPHMAVIWAAGKGGRPSGQSLLGYPTLQGCCEDRKTLDH